MKKKFGIIAVTYGKYFNYSFLYSILEQTYGDFDLHLYHDGEDYLHLQEIVTTCINASGGMVDNVFWHTTDERKNQFGHDLRDLGIQEQADKYEYLLITNCDNYYVPVFLQEIATLLALSPERVTENYDYFPPVGVVYFDYIHSHNRGDSSSGGTYGFMNNDFRPCVCDIGAFVTRAGILKELGFKGRHNEADASLIQEILELQKTKNFGIMKLPKVLFIHN